MAVTLPLILLPFLSWMISARKGRDTSARTKSAVQGLSVLMFPPPGNADAGRSSETADDEDKAGDRTLQREKQGRIRHVTMTRGHQQTAWRPAMRRILGWRDYGRSSEAETAGRATHGAAGA